MVLPEYWDRAGKIERARVRYVAPRQIKMLFGIMVHPGVYRSVGLPGFETWRAVNKTPHRLALRYAATRPILETLVDVGAVRGKRIPKGWQELCGVDRARRAGQSLRSTISGAWSEGPVPLRALRSTTAHVTRSATGGVASTWSIRMPRCWWKSPAR